MEHYTKLANDLLAAYATGDAAAARNIRSHFRLKRTPSKEEVRSFVQQQLRKRAKTKSAKFTLSGAQYMIARSCAFASWSQLKKHIEAVSKKKPAVAQFEAAVESIITGDVAALRRLLRKNPKLIRARSTRMHHSMLLHYIGANGVEDYRQKTPTNAVEILKVLLGAGADVNALSDSYGKSSTLGLVATSIHPAHAGVHIALMEALLQAGARLDAAGGSDVNACLANGRAEAANFLAGRGARLDLEGAAGVGRLDLVQKLWRSPKRQKERGFMWACEYGQADVVRFFLDHGFDIGAQVNGLTGLHWALVGGHIGTIKLLVERKAPLEARNAYGGTAIGCATWAVMHSDPVYRWPDAETDWAAIIETLFAAGAKVDQADYPTGNQAVDEVLRRHGAR